MGKNLSKKIVLERSLDENKIIFGIKFMENYILTSVFAAAVPSAVVVIKLLDSLAVALSASDIFIQN